MSFRRLDSRNTNTLWCDVAVRTLADSGLRQAVISPGSRSTPLTMALAAHPEIETIPVLDERSAGFFALGLTRRSHCPVVLVCTSGSAAANYLPAVIEASESRVPLIVLTADRPPELRDCASGQTIDQTKLFGTYVSWYHELAVPEPRLELLGYLRQTLRQAWRRAVDGARPVHLNAPFRDPLPPLPDQGDAAKVASELDETFWSQPEPPRTVGGGLRLLQKVTTTRGIIVAGAAQPKDPVAYAGRIAEIARATGWPILADVLSPLRQYSPKDVCVVTAYDTLLRNDTVARDLTPRFVIALEGWPTSKILRQWLERSQAEMLLVSEYEGARDAIHGRTREITAPATALEIEGAAPADASYVNAWREVESRVRGRLDDWFTSDTEQGFEGRAAWALNHHIPDGAAVVVANSMPVRDLEYFWGASDRGIEVYFSRGANGIDGTLSTALGVAHRANRPVFLYTGDLAFLHDSNGMMLAKELVGSLTVVVINNDGGGIFGHLPVAMFDPPFERYFATPQSVDLEKLCAAHGIPHIGSAQMTGLPELFSNPPETGMSVIELKTDRKADAATRKRLFRDAAK